MGIFSDLQHRSNEPPSEVEPWIEQRQQFAEVWNDARTLGERLREVINPEEPEDIGLSRAGALQAFVRLLGDFAGLDRVGEGLWPVRSERMAYRLAAAESLFLVLNPLDTSELQFVREATIEVPITGSFPSILERIESKPSGVPILEKWKQLFVDTTGERSRASLLVSAAHELEEMVGSELGVPNS